MPISPHSQLSHLDKTIATVSDLTKADDGN